MERLQYPIPYDESVTRWWITGMQKEPFESPVEAFDAEVNLGEAYVQIVYPVRNAFLSERRIQEVGLYTGGFDRVYFPFENNRIDYSTFLHTPHYIWFNARTWLEAPEEGIYQFEIYTCGGVKLWLNGEEAALYAPYTRNIAGSVMVSLPLKKGLNELCVYADELAERDVFFYFELRHKSEKPLNGVLLLEQSAEEIQHVEQFLTGCYFDRDCYFSGELALHYDPALLKGDMPIRVDSRTKGFPGIGKTAEDSVFHVTATKDADHVVLGRVEDLAIGVFKLMVGAQAGEFMIERPLVVGLLASETACMQPAPTIAERKLQALSFIAENGEHVVNRAMAIAHEKGELDDEAVACIIASLRTIEDKEDCADFYLAPMLWLMQLYGGLIDEKLYARMKKAILEFRYWIDEPGNDVMWYFSENHAFLFHLAQYITGDMFPDEVFLSSGRRGTEQKQLGLHRLEDWFDTFFRYGYAEWNSATYIPIDLIGLFVLYELAPDEEMKDAAKRALDFTFQVMQYNSFHGVMSSSYGRAYEGTLKAREQVETTFVNWVAYGQGLVNYRTRPTSLFALSSYEPPCYDADCALEGDEWMETQLDQGINAVKTYAYKTSSYFTGSVRRFRPFEHGHQQHLMNVAMGTRLVQFYLNHPGERSFSGENRPSYWAGNGTMPLVDQYRNITGMIFHTDPSELVHYIHAYATLYDYDEWQQEEKWFFFRVEDAYTGVWFSKGCRVVEKGANTGKELIADGLDHGVIVKCGSEAEFGSFEAFCEKLRAAAPEFDGETMLRFEDPQYGEFKMTREETLVAGVPLSMGAVKELQVLRGRLEKA